MQKRQIPEKGFASIKNDITGSELASGIVDTLQKSVVILIEKAGPFLTLPV